jgi:hypothetical protein
MNKRHDALIFAVISTLLLGACGSVVKPATTVTEAPFPQVSGESLTGERVAIPDAYRGKNTLLLIGYTQKAQFDIDRWILGVLQAAIPVEIVEVPTIAGMMPQMVQGFINNGMRSGIPQSDWASVVTVYKDAAKIVELLGNERPQSAYAVLLNRSGVVVWSSNIGYSASQILTLKQTVQGLAR